jgi:hypothetical protein
MNYEIKNLKTGWSREYGDGGSYTCTLYRDGKQVAKIREAGDGGCQEHEWLDRGKPRVEITVHDYNGDTRTYSGTPEQKLFAEYADSQTYEWEYDDKPQRHSPDTLVGHLVAKFEETKQFKKWCRTKTYFRLKGDKEGQWSYFKVKYSPEVKRQIEARYGDQLEEILNERFQ